ncbi:S-methyl-5'-thioadenosine phosphorylase [Deferribacterales bacterium RsTz2092]|nr:methylthioadenosine phosphorylase [Deferribacterales bacterium]
MLGIIGGSGLYSLSSLELAGEIKLETPYGAPSGTYKHYKYNGESIYMLARHGSDHSIAPHRVNYRANIDGFAQLGVGHILAFTAVGGIADWLKPGDIVVPDNGIDMTNSRASTYFDEGEVRHIDFTTPFCESLREKLIAIMNNSFTLYKNKGVYVCTNGPRLETAAEIRAYKQLGADIVGMTLFPECVLAREKGICYVNVSTVTNYAAGVRPALLKFDDIKGVMGENSETIAKISVGLAGARLDKTCRCDENLEGAKANGNT